MILLVSDAAALYSAIASTVVAVGGGLIALYGKHLDTTVKSIGKTTSATLDQVAAGDGEMLVERIKKMEADLAGHDDFRESTERILKQQSQVIEQLLATQARQEHSLDRLDTTLGKLTDALLTMTLTKALTTGGEH